RCYRDWSSDVCSSDLNAQIIEDIWQNRDRAYNIRILARRLQRVDKQMSGDARDLFAAFVPSGDMAAFALALPQRIKDHFTAVMRSEERRVGQECRVCG